MRSDPSPYALTPPPARRPNPLPHPPPKRMPPLPPPSSLTQEDEESCDADGGDASCSADGDADEGWPRRMRLAGSSLSTTAILLLLQYWWAKSCFLDGWR